MTVLLTGFEPFAGETVNPSWLMLEAFDGMLIDQFGVIHDGQTLYPGTLSVMSELKALNIPVAVMTNSGKRAEANRRAQAEQAEQAKKAAEEIQLKVISLQQAQDELEEQLQNEQQLHQQKLQQVC